MSKFIVETINELSEIYANIRERVVNEGEFLESDRMFCDFYDKFIKDIFNVEKRRDIPNE